MTWCSLASPLVGLKAKSETASPLAPQREDQLAWAAGHHLLVEQRADASLQHVVVFVLAGVRVQRSGQRPGGYGVLDEREALAGLRAVDHETDPDASQEARLAVLRPDDFADAVFIVALPSIARKPGGAR